MGRHHNEDDATTYYKRADFGSLARPQKIFDARLEAARTER